VTGTQALFDFPDTDLDVARRFIQAGIPVFTGHPNPQFDASTPARTVNPALHPDEPGEDGGAANRVRQDGHESRADIEFRLPSGWHHTTASMADLDRWRPGDALCLLAGHGIDVIDVDTKNGADPEEHLARLQGVGVEVLGHVITPSGGAHFYVASSGICSTNAPGIGVDYRGRGLDGSGAGMVYMPGTKRPRYDGAGYEWMVAPDLEILARLTETTVADMSWRAEQADAVATYLTGLGISIRSRKAHSQIASSEPLPESIPSSLADLVGDLGPEWDVGSGQGRRRSGDRSERFFRIVAECRRASLTQGQAVTLVDPWCHGVGKYVGRVAGEVARAWPKVESPDPAPGHPQHGSELMHASAPSPGEPWEDPIPVPTRTTTAPTIDLSGLPRYLRGIVEAVTEQAQCPPEIALAAALSTLAAATRGAWDVRVTPAWNAGPTVLWFAAFARSGERKGSGQSPIIAPLADAERAIAADVRRANRIRESERKRLTAALKAAEAEDDPTKVEPLLDQLHAARERPVPSMLVSDTTTEALGVSLGLQGGAAAIVGSEASAFQTVAGRYSDAGGNFGLLNHAYDGDAYSDLRIKRRGMNIHRPALSWCVAVQPDVMAGYANAQSEGSGFLARFVLLAPESRVGSRSMRTHAAPDEIVDQWAAVVRRLHGAAWYRFQEMCEELPDSLGAPGQVALDSEAEELIKVYAERLEAEKAAGSDILTLGGWIEKHPARMARIAAILALADDPHTATVRAPHVVAALSIADALIAHALAGFSVLRSEAATDTLARTLEGIRRIGTPTVTTREVYKRLKDQTSWVHATSDVRRALEDLTELGHLRSQPRTPGPTGGRAPEVWDVHPRLMGGR